MAHIIVVGNEKGGSGKSTSSMHVATALGRMGHRVGGLDLDVRQRSFGRYLEKRAHFLQRERLDLPMPVIGNLAEGSEPLVLRPDGLETALRIHPGWNVLDPVPAQPDCPYAGRYAYNAD